MLTKLLDGYLLAPPVFRVVSFFWINANLLD